MVRGGEAENPTHEGRWRDAHRPAVRQALLLLDSIFVSREGRTATTGQVFALVRSMLCLRRSQKSLVSSFQAKYIFVRRVPCAVCGARCAVLSHNVNHLSCVRLRFGATISPRFFENWIRL